ncbi:MAG: response regulator transcription factor [Methylococcales bacterium]|nr:response regulator transcription factor [Methylococcales bacterium]
MVKFLLIDDHELITMGLQGILNAVDDFSVIGIADSGEQGIVIVDELRPDVILLDVEMPGMGGAEACRRILKIHPDIKIIGLSQHDNSSAPKQLLKIGALDFISKNTPPDEMLTIIRRVIAGEGTSPYAAKTKKDKKASFYAKLSAREAEIVRFLLQGKSIQEMANILRRSDKTINTYRYRIHKKLKVKNDIEVVLLFDQFK